MSVFDAVEVLAEFSKAIRHGLIALEGLYDLDGVDRGKMCALTDSVRQVHAETADYLASVIGAASVQEYKEKRRQ
ncbi:MAG: hypothetical protein ABJF23_31525 [Bryobacteraceae bacterium]